MDDGESVVSDDDDWEIGDDDDEAVEEEGEEEEDHRGVKRKREVTAENFDLENFDCDFSSNFKRQCLGDGVTRDSPDFVILKHMSAQEFWRKINLEKRLYNN